MCPFGPDSNKKKQFNSETPAVTVLPANLITRKVQRVPDAPRLEFTGGGGNEPSRLQLDPRFQERHFI